LLVAYGLISTVRDLLNELTKFHRPEIFFFIGAVFSFASFSVEALSSILIALFYLISGSIELFE